MIVTAALAAAVFLISVFLLDRAARRRAWRLGRWTQPFGRKGLVYVRGTPMTLDGWCEECRTGWRYALPHVTLIRRESVVAISVICEKCYRGMPLDNVIRVYAEWWVERVRRMQERGEQHDPGEFDDIRAALRVGG